MLHYLDEHALSEYSPDLSHYERGKSVKDLLFVFLGGGVGSVCRYLMSTGINKYSGNSLAWGTATVNLAGCFIIGVLVGLVDRELLPREFRILLVTGFLVTVQFSPS